MNDASPRPDAIRIADLTKTYRLGLRMRTVVALDGLHLRVDEGSIYGFVGPNGAGKSTTIKMLVGLLSPTRGEAAIFGCSIRDVAARRSIGYLPENPAFHDFLRPLEVLSLPGQALRTLRGRPARAAPRRCCGSSASPRRAISRSASSRRGWCSVWASPRRSSTTHPSSSSTSP